MYKQFHKNNGKRSMWNMEHETYVRTFDGKSIRLHKINDVVYSGEKEVFRLRLNNGRQIKATANHKIMTYRGWKPLSDLKQGDEVMCDTLRPQIGKQKRFKLKDVSLTTKFHPYANKLSRVEVHRLIYESKLNELHFLNYLDIIWNDEIEAKRLKYIDPSKFHIHHKDGCHYNNSIDNLELIDVSDHLLLHAKKDESFRNFNQGIPNYSGVLSIEPAGVEDTYDIVCDEPHHNFVANGMVVHNSGKSHFAQTMAYYLSDGNFGVEHIVFDPKQFKEAVLKRERYKAIVFDEAFRGMSARAAMTSTNRILMSMLQEIRQKNLFIIMVLPSIWDLDKYISLHRTKGCFHVHTDNRKGRGYFKFYNKDQIMNLLRDFKLKYKYPKAPKFKGRFTMWRHPMITAYTDKKSKALGVYAYDDAEETKNTLTEEKSKQEITALISLLKKHRVSDKRIGEAIGLTRDAIVSRRIKAKCLRNGEFVGYSEGSGMTNVVEDDNFSEDKEEAT